MIQRIQSVYLFLAAILNISIFFNALYERAQADPVNWISLGFAVILVLAAVASIATIFLYNNRDFQVKATEMVIGLQVIAFGWGVAILISLGGFGHFLLDESLGALFLLIALISTIMARKKIKDDKELVQSMDRIR